MARERANTKTAPVPENFKGDRVNVDESATVLHYFPLGRDLGVVSISAYNGKRALDLRRFYQNDANEWCPTAKGIRVPIENAPALIEALTDHLNSGDVK